MRSLQFGVKHLLDRLIGLLLLVVLAPLLAAIALGIKLADGGPPFFRQARVGRQGRPFVIWKFRTMPPGTDRLLDEKGRAGYVKRVTGVGKLLRSTSLDELPQLFNILNGTMSLIGPRPAVPSHLERYTAQQKKRLAMKPGVTGLAQVSGRNLLSWSRRIELDIAYIERYSLWLDFKILLRTVRVVLLREGIVVDTNPAHVDDLADDNPRTRAKTR